MNMYIKTKKKLFCFISNNNKTIDWTGKKKLIYYSFGESKPFIQTL